MANKNRYIISFLLTCSSVLVSQFCFAQDSTKLKLQFDSLWSLSPVTISMASLSADYTIMHHPTKEDSNYCKKYSSLEAAEPTKKNHSQYYSLACSLWELGRLKEAEALFLKIMGSHEPYYTGTYYHSSDIPGDTTTNTYGYGSYTSNYKNQACQYLTKIYIEEKKFDQALIYIRLADKKYTVQHNCGTGYRWYREEVDGLYSLAYEGSGQYDSIIHMLLPQYAGYSNGILIRALKKTYSQSEINEYLKIAEQSIVCVVDTFQSSSYIIHNYGEKNETSTEIKYTSGTGTMSLFGREVTLPTVSLENGEIITRERLINDFKTSGFYTALIDNG